MHTLLDLRDATFRVLSTSRMASLHGRSCPRYALAPKPEPSTSCDRGYVDFARLYVRLAPSRSGLLRHALPVGRTSMLIASIISAPTDRSTGIICDQTISLDGFYTRQPRLPRTCGASASRTPLSDKTLVFITNNFSLPAATICALYKSRWQVELLLQVDQAVHPSDQAVLRHVGERALKTQIWIAVSVYVLAAIAKKRLDRSEVFPRTTLYTLLQRSFSVSTLFEKNAHTSSTCGRRKQHADASQITQPEFIRLLTRTLAD